MTADHTLTKRDKEVAVSETLGYKITYKPINLKWGGKLRSLTEYSNHRYCFSWLCLTHSCCFSFKFWVWFSVCPMLLFILVVAESVTESATCYHFATGFSHQLYGCLMPLTVCSHQLLFSVTRPTAMKVIWYIF